MMEAWKDTAFGSDFGGDFLTLVESLDAPEVNLGVIYRRCDLQRYVADPTLLLKRTDNNVFFTPSEFEQYVHFEDAVIAIAAIMVESQACDGVVDLTKAYGSKTIRFTSTNSDRLEILTALEGILANPDHYVLFEMCRGEERASTLADLHAMASELKKTTHQ
ncbi:MAG: hypothetical protein IPO40_13680 [Fibrobacteres bacterium]|nr:hypothetical protein [Fibrobacterota bacterium]